MTSGVTYTIPELQVLPVDEFDEAPGFAPETLVLDCGFGNGGQRYWRPYRTCYLDRRSLDQTVVKGGNESLKVNLLSLCPERTDLIRKIVTPLLEGQGGVPKFEHVEQVINWLDFQDRAADLKSIDGARSVYRDYTDLLFHRVSLSNVGEGIDGIGYAMGSILQRTIKYICMCSLGMADSIIESWAKRIPNRQPGENELPSPLTTASENNLAYALHKRLFDAFSQAVLKNTVPPVVVEINDQGFDDLIIYNQQATRIDGVWRTSNRNTDWMSYFYRREGVFEGKHSEFKALLAGDGVEYAPRGDSFKLNQDRNRQYSIPTLRLLANNAVRHFGYLLLAEAGNNAAHLSNIDCSEFRLDKALGVAQMRAIKGRAEYEDQPQYVDLRFAKTTWKQYLKLRAWMAEIISSPPSRGVFLLGSQLKREPYTLLNATSIKELSFWPKDAPSTATRPARKHRTVNLLEASGGNLPMVASLQSATTRTIERHYAFKNRIEAAEVMSNYFQLQSQSAQLRYSGVEPVRVIEGGDSVAAGQCAAEHEESFFSEDVELESLSSEVIEVIKPRCSAPITCIFCGHFALHAECEDFLRLLTIKQWIEVQSRRSVVNIDDHYTKFALFTDRIDHILNVLPATKTIAAGLIEEAESRFYKGERDPYWSAKIAALLEMEEA